MKKRNKIIAVVLVAALGTGIAIAGSGKGCHGGYHKTGMHHGGGHMISKIVGHMSDRLDLTDDQRGQLEKIKSSKMDTMESLHQQKKEIRSLSMGLQPESESYDNDVVELAEKSANIARQVALLMGESYKEVSTILTPEQRVELNKMMEKRLRQKGHHKHHQNDDA